MKYTGKHQTNIAGEWRVGDIVIEKRKVKEYFLCNVCLIKIDQPLSNGYFLYECPESGLEKRSPQSRFLNITEMQRALGRV